MSRRNLLACAVGLEALVLALLLSACRASVGVTTGDEKGQALYGRLIKLRGGSYRLISADDLVQIVQTSNPYLVNVHIPYEGEIEATDAFIPFSEIEKHLNELPPDKDALIVLYCRAGVMSADASRVLARLGYTRVHDLKGGMTAWKAAGHEVVVKER